MEAATYTPYQPEIKNVDLHIARCTTMVIPGRSNETRVAVISTLGSSIHNSNGVISLGGVFDGHSEEGTAGKLAEDMLDLFLRGLNSVSTRGGFERHLELAVSWAQVRVLQNYQDDEGVTGSIFLATKEQLYLVRVGDGDAHLRPERSLFSVVEERQYRFGIYVLNVPSSWGDKTFKVQCNHPCTAEISGPIPLAQVRGMKLLLRDDGLTMMLERGDSYLLENIFRYDLAQMSRRISDVMQEHDKLARRRRVTLADDIGCLELQFPQ